MAFKIDFNEVNSSPIEKADKAMDSVKESMKSIGGEAVTVGKGIKQSMVTSPVDKMKSATNKLKDKMKSATDETTLVGKAMEKLKQSKAMQILSKSVEAVGRTVVKTRDRFKGMSGILDHIKTSRIGEKVGTSLDKMKGPLDTAINKAKGLGEAFKVGLGKAKQYLSEAGEQLKKLQKGMESVGKKLTTRLTMPIVGAGTAGTKMYLDLETGIKKVSTLADGGILPVDKIQSEVRAISDASGISQTEISEAIYGALSAGVESDKVMSFVRSGIDLTRAGFTDMETAIDATTTVMNAYGDDAFEMSKIHDIFVQTQDKGKISVDELGKSLGRVVPTASDLGVNLDQLGASYAILTSKGQSAELATTNLNAMLGEIGKSGSESDKMLKELTGKGFKELTKEGKNAGEILGILEGGASNAGLSLKDMFGSQSAGAAAVTLLSDGVDGYNKSLKDMNDAEGKTAKNAAAMEDGMLKIQKATTKVKNALIDFGAMIAPTVEIVADKVSGLVDKFNELSDESKGMVGKFILVAAAIGPVLWILSKVIGVALGVGPALGAIGTVLGFIVSPAGIVIAVIAGLVAVIAHLWKTNEAFRDKVIGIWNTIKDSLSVAIEFIQRLWETHGESIKNTLSLVFETVQNIFLFAFDIIVGIVTLGVGIVKGIWSLFGETLTMLASSAWDTIMSVIEGAMNIIQGAIDLVMGIITGDWERAWTGVQSIFEGVVTILKAVWQGAVDLLTAPVDALVNLLDTAFKNKLDGVKKAWEGLKTFMKNPIKGTVGLVQKGAGWVSDKLGFPHKDGAYNIPYDNYPANLHKNEMVLTAAASNQFRAMGGTEDSVPNIQNISNNSVDRSNIIRETVNNRPENKVTNVDNKVNNISNVLDQLINNVSNVFNKQATDRSMNTNNETLEQVSNVSNIDNINNKDITKSNTLNKSILDQLINNVSNVFNKQATDRSMNTNNETLEQVSNVSNIDNINNKDITKSNTLNKSILDQLINNVSNVFNNKDISNDSTNRYMEDNENNYNNSTTVIKRGADKEKATMPAITFSPVYNIELSGTATESDKQELEKVIDRKTRELFNQLFKEMSMKMA